MYNMSAAEDSSVYEAQMNKVSVFFLKEHAAVCSGFGSLNKHHMYFALMIISFQRFRFLFTWKRAAFMQSICDLLNRSDKKIKNSGLVSFMVVWFWD